MSLRAATHSGSFHADDVLAWALIRRFHDQNATLVRTRGPEVIAGCDLVFDVGGLYDPEAKRFDHHQQSYTGPHSSAGMILVWLEDTAQIEAGLAARLRERLVRYIDAVDTGARAPEPAVPCLASMVDAFNAGCSTPETFYAAFCRASDIAFAWVDAYVQVYADEQAALSTVREGMQRAEEAGSVLIELDRYFRWQDPYFALGGAEHSTAFVLQPGTDGAWRVLTIPPEPGSFDQKRPLPEAWAGLRDEALEAVTGVVGSRFCHKNRFIAVFETREGALEALRGWALI